MNGGFFHGNLSLEVLYVWHRYWGITIEEFSIIFPCNKEGDKKDSQHISPLVGLWRSFANNELCAYCECVDK